MMPRFIMVSKKGMTKGITPMIATVLLIAFAVAVGAVMGPWIRSFVMSTTGDVSDYTETEIYCTYGGISVSNLQYCNDYLSGRIKNTNLVDLGNITIQIIFSNATSQQRYLCQNGSICPTRVMALTPGELASFNVSIGGSNYDTIHVYTNCSNVYDDATSGDVTAC